jgi:hypothetical protein
LPATISGEFDFTDVMDAANRSGQISIQAAGARMHNVALDQLTGSIVYRGPQVELGITGRTLEGDIQFRGSGKCPPQQLVPQTLSGKILIDKVRLGQLWAAVDGWHRLRPLQAVASGTLDVQMAGLEQPPRGGGRMQLSDIRWHGEMLTQEASARLFLDEQQLRVRELQCELAGGTAEGEVTLYPASSRPAAISLRFQRISARQLGRLLDRRLPRFDASVTVLLRGNLGSTWTGTADVQVASGSLEGIPLRGVRLPIQWSLSPRTGAMRALSRIRAARVAGGRFDGQLDVRWQNRLSLRTEGRVDRLDIRPFAQAVPGVTDTLRGRLDGEFSIQGSDIRSLRDLSGNMDISLTDSTAMQLPILRALTTSLGIVSPASTTFSSTKVNAKLARGVLRIQKMTMTSTDHNLYITGKITTAGRLDLEVTADAARAVTLGVLTGVLRPTDFLLRRLLFFHIGGSVRSPNVQPRVAEFLQQEIVLFFLPFLGLR